MKYILYSVIFITLLFCNRKEASKTVQKPKKEFIDDSLVYEVINAVLEMPEISEYKTEYMINCSYILDFAINDDKKDFYQLTEKYFEENDTLSVYNQIEKSKISYYKEGFIKGIKLIDYDLTKIATSEQFDSLNKSIKKYRPYITISYPIFNKSRNVVHISYGDDSFTKRFFMKKINGKWEIIDIIEHTVF